MLVVIGLVLCFTTAKAQTPKVNATLNFSDYDVIYLTDFIDVKTQKLNSSISGISLDLTVVSPPGGSVPVCIYVVIQVQLRGDARPEILVSGFTNDITINRSLTLYARDFAKNGSGVAVLRNDNYFENDALKN